MGRTIRIFDFDARISPDKILFQKTLECQFPCVKTTKSLMVCQVSDANTYNLLMVLRVSA